MTWLEDREIRLILQSTNDIFGALQLAAKMGGEKARMGIWDVEDPHKAAVNRALKAGEKCTS